MCKGHLTPVIPPVWVRLRPPAGPHEHRQDSGAEALRVSLHAANGASCSCHDGTGTKMPCGQLASSGDDGADGRHKARTQVVATAEGLSIPHAGWRRQ